MSLTTSAPSEALTPMNKAAPQTRRPGPASAQAGGGEFAQFMRLQAQAEEAAPTEKPVSSAEPEQGDDEAAVKDEHADGSEEAPNDKSKLPKKLQLSAEDLAADLRPTAAVAIAPNLMADRARDLAARLGAQTRAQRGTAADPTLRAEAIDEGLKAEALPRFGDALAGAAAPDGATALRGVDLPERPIALPVLAEPVTAALPQPEATASLNANPLPVETTAATPLPTQATLQETPGTAAFNAALGAQLNVWVSEGVEMAQLELNPRDLGPIEVRIAMRDGQARIELGADVTSTREALAQALPSLAEALGDVGVQLAGSGLSDQGHAQRQAQQDAGRQPSAALAALAQAFGRADDAAHAPEAHERASAQGRPRSLVDLVA